jgi:hypothetical protein
MAGDVTRYLEQTMLYTIEGSDVNAIEPVNGVIHVAGIIRSPQTMIGIRWEVDGASGKTECEAWRGQHEIDGLVRAGYTIKSVELL